MSELKELKAVEIETRDIFNWDENNSAIVELIKVIFNCEDV